MRNPTRGLTFAACALSLVATIAGCQTPETPTPTDPPTQPAQQWTMPDLAGRTLQQAQDEVQSLTGGDVFFTSSHDATGQNRSQVVDSNWKVCTQSVAAGTPITAGTRIDFGAVQLDETCP